MAHDDEGLVAEHLSEEVDVLGSVGCAQMFAIVENHPAVVGILFFKFARYHLRCLGKEGIVLCHCRDVVFEYVSFVIFLWNIVSLRFVLLFSDYGLLVALPDYRVPYNCYGVYGG